MYTKSPYDRAHVFTPRLVSVHSQMAVEQLCMLCIMTDGLC